VREVRDLGLSMTWVAATRPPDGALLRIFFRAPERVDFRELSRRLRRELGSRVELWRLDDRRAAGLSGDLGRCGRELCCASWLERPGQVPVATLGRRVKGTSDCGVCGRLRCCLRYERGGPPGAPAGN
jgi:cell fate regulator YaaT (PSP1 superfamily)